MADTPSPGLLPGSYVIGASSSGFEVEQQIVVEAGKTEMIELELKPTEVKSSVTVTASAQDTQQASPTAAVNEETLRDAPNINERFESALPLLPGVVRGPDGRINLKGARSTQSGALVNSANVTDPATGSPRSMYLSTSFRLCRSSPIRTIRNMEN